MASHPNLVLLLAQSTLSPKQQEELTALFAHATDKQQRETIQTLTAHPDWIKKLYQNFTQKKKLLNAGDADAWKKFLVDELDQILNADEE